MSAGKPTISGILQKILPAYFPVFFSRLLFTMLPAVARNILQEKWHQLQYFYRSSGVGGVSVEVLRRLFAPIYHHNVGHFMIYRIDTHGAEAQPVGGAEQLSMEPVVVQDAAALMPFEAELSTKFNYSVQELRSALDKGSILFLIRRPREEEKGHEVVGYSLHERGVVLLFGRRYPFARNMLFLHYTEVLPSFRGLHIASYIAQVVAAYSRTAGINRWCTWIGTANQAALKARVRIGWFMLGRIQQVSLLGGLVKWQTPWQEVEAMLSQ